MALTWIFTSDVIVRFADFPEMHGQAELKRLLVARVERQPDEEHAREKADRSPGAVREGRIHFAKSRAASRAGGWVGG